MEASVAEARQRADAELGAARLQAAQAAADAERRLARELSAELDQALRGSKVELEARYLAEIDALRARLLQAPDPEAAGGADPHPDPRVAEAIRAAMRERQGQVRAALEAQLERTEAKLALVRQRPL